MEARVSQKPVVALISGDQTEVNESAPSDVPADQKEAGAGEEGGADEEPGRRRNGSLTGRISGRLVEMMPELLH
jgi:hypothetical protein